MPRIRAVGEEARARLVSGAGGHDQRQPYRDAIAGLGAGDVIEVIPESGEALRTLKVRLRRAAREVGRVIRYGETVDDTLLVWLAPGQRRRRRTTDREGQDQGPASPTPQEELPP
jgi:hypothetical protein